MEPFHPEQGAWLIGSCTLDGDQNGFFKAVVTAPEYANTGHGNAKIAWVSGDLVRVVEKSLDVDLEKETFPLWERYNPEKGETEYGPMTHVGKGWKRGSGDYGALEFFISPNAKNNSLSVANAIIYDGFLLISRAEIAVEHDPGLSTDFALVKVEEENEIGDVEERCVIKMKSAEKIYVNAAFNLLKSPDSSFKSFMDTMFPGGEVQTNEVIVANAYGPAEAISYKNIPASLGETKTYIMNCAK